MWITKFISKVWESFCAGGKQAVEKEMGERVSIGDKLLLMNYQTALELGNISVDDIIPITVSQHSIGDIKNKNHWTHV